MCVSVCMCACVLVCVCECVRVFQNTTNNGQHFAVARWVGEWGWLAEPKGLLTRRKFILRQMSSATKSIDLNQNAPAICCQVDLPCHVKLGHCCHTLPSSLPLSRFLSLYLSITLCL